MNLASEIHDLVRAGTRCIRLVTPEEDEARVEVNDAAMKLGLPVRAWTAVQGVFDGLVSGPTAKPGTENAGAALLHMAREDKPTLFVLLDIVPYLAQDERTLRAWRELLLACDRTGGSVVMIDHSEASVPVVASVSTRVDVPLPDEAALEQVVRSTYQRLHREHRAVAEISRQDLAMLVANLRGLTRRQAGQLVAEAVFNDLRLCAKDLPTVLKGKRRLLQGDGVLEPVDAPQAMDDIGGMVTLKKWLSKRAGALSRDAENFGLVPPRGILLLGVQGGGKSLCAKAVATAWSRPLLRMDVGRLYDRYIGESERRLRLAFAQAERMAPIVLWIDEIEKAFASSASQSSDGGLSRRMFGELLTWMQEHRSPVFLVATANDIEALPPELLRKGRFDEIFFVDLPGEAAREEIVRIHLKRRRRNPDDFSVSTLVAASAGFSGAEIEQAILAALHDAHAEGRELQTADVVRSMEASPPLSVTMAERMAALRTWATGRCVPAD